MDQNSSSMSDNASGKRLQETITLLGELVAFDTESSKSNWPIVRHIEDYLKARDVPYVIVPNDIGDKAAIFATVGPMRDGGVILSGHTDVVPVEGQTWTSNPFTMRRDGSRLYGRGTTDMKGFDSVCLAMIDEFKQVELSVPIHIMLSYDEEIGCLGPLDTIARFGKDLPMPGSAIIGEPTQMHVADAHKAIASYRTVVHGKEAHSSKPYLGANANRAACELVAELYRYADEYVAGVDAFSRFDPPYATLSVGTIHGGTARNILAKECAFGWEFRSLPGMAQNEAAARLEKFTTEHVLPQLQRYAPDAFVETFAGVEVPGLAPDPGSSAETLALKLTRSNQTIAVAYATEAGQFQKGGVPSVVCGPGSINQAHQPDEFIEISELEACIGFMRRLAGELSG